MSLAERPGASGEGTDCSGPSDLNLPSALYVKTLRQFDELVLQDLVFYSPTLPKLIELPSGHSLQFRICPHLRKKPMLSTASALSAANPFLDPDPRLVVEEEIQLEKQSNAADHYGPAGLGPTSFQESVFEVEDKNASRPVNSKHTSRAKHRLMINKYCVYRPQLLVTTRDFASQADDLDTDDLEACWAVMRALGEGSKLASEHPSLAAREEDGGRPDQHASAPLPLADPGVASASPPEQFMMIYNCGVHSGNSQPHKHMQIFPQPSAREYALFPGAKHLDPRAVAVRAGVQLWRCLKVPFWHVSARVDGLQREVGRGGSREAAGAGAGAGGGATYAGGQHAPSSLDQLYAVLLAEAKRELRQEGVRGRASYNVILTHEWMTIIPRTHAGGNGLMVNAAGMAGLIWLSREIDMEYWTPEMLQKVIELCGLVQHGGAPGED